MFIIIHKDCHKYYFKDEELKIEHNSYGCSYRGVYPYKEYLINGELHNIHGPAVIYNIASDYYLNGVFFTYFDWEIFRNKNGG